MYNYLCNIKTIIKDILFIKRCLKCEKIGCVVLIATQSEKYTYSSACPSLIDGFLSRGWGGGGGGYTHILVIQWNLVIKRSDITKPSYNKVILLFPALYISLFLYPDIMRNLI